MKHEPITNPRPADFLPPERSLSQTYARRSYSSERAALDSAIDEHAGTDASYFASSAFAEQASSYCNSDARSFEVAASFKGFGVQVDASTSTGSSLAQCGSQSAASSYTGRNGGQNSYFYGYNSKLQEAKFGEAKANVKQLRSTVCGSDSSVNSNSDSVGYLQQVLEPAVVGAYTGCLELFKAGLQVGAGRVCACVCVCVCVCVWGGGGDDS